MLFLKQKNAKKSRGTKDITLASSAFNGSVCCLQVDLSLPVKTSQFNLSKYGGRTTQQSVRMMLFAQFMTPAGKFDFIDEVGNFIRGTFRTQRVTDFAVIFGPQKKIFLSSDLNILRV